MNSESEYQLKSQTYSRAPSFASSWDPPDPDEQVKQQSCVCSRRRQFK